MRSFVSNLLILLGLLCISYSLLLNLQRTNPNRLSFASTPATFSTDNISSTPVRIVIQRIGIDLPLVPTKQSGIWETTGAGVSYLSSSTIPGNVGNSILYGHNWESILGRLPSIKPGDEIEIVFPDTKKIFVVESTAVVDPTATDVLKQTSDRRITVYTCAGFLDSKRFVTVAISKGE